MKAIILNLTLLFFNIFLIHAQDGAYEVGAQGGTIFPINNNFIELLNQEVHYNQDKEEFISKLVLYNTSSETQKIQIAFPVIPSYYSEDYYEGIVKKENVIMNEILETFKFKMYINGKETLTKLSKLDSNEICKFAFITSVSFLPTEKISLNYVYKQAFGHGGDNMGRQWSDIECIISPGSKWKGDIKRASIKFHMNNSTNLSLKIDTIISRNFYAYGYDVYKFVTITNGWTFSVEPTKIDPVNKMILWEFNDFEPDFEIKLTKRSPYNVHEGFLFSSYFDTLSNYIIQKDSIGYDRYFNYLSNNKYLLGKLLDNKRLCELFYEQYAKDFIEEHDISKNIEYKSNTRHIVNAFAALQGYSFKNEKWAKLFQLFEWYVPLTKEPKYTEKQLELIDKILLYEKGNKNK